MSGGANIWDPGSEQIIISNAAGTYIRETQAATEGQTSVKLATFMYTLGVNALQVFIDGSEVSITEATNDTFLTPFPLAEGQTIVIWGLFGARNSQTQETIQLVEAEIAGVIGKKVLAGDNISVKYDPVSKNTTVSASTGKAFKNKIINPFFRTDYRNMKAAQTPAALSGWVCDRWKFSNSQASKLTYQAGAVTTIPGFESCLKVTVASAVAVAAAEKYSVLQNILATNLQELKWNSASAESVYLRVAIKSSVSGKFPVKLVGLQAPNYGYVGVLNLVAGQAADYLLEVPGPVVFSMLQGVQPLLTLELLLGYGSTFYESNLATWKVNAGLGPADGMQFVSVPGATIEITGVELGVGAAGEREFLPIEVEEDLCAKYFERTTKQWLPTIFLLSYVSILEYREKIRIPVSVIIDTTANWVVWSNAGSDISIVSYNVIASSKSQTRISYGASSGQSAGQANFLHSVNPGFFLVDADW